MNNSKILWWMLFIAMAVVIVWSFYWKESDYDKCLKANKEKQEGEECISCTPDGSKMAVYKGVIKNGICK
jgi:hypothetical protein